MFDNLKNLRQLSSMLGNMGDLKEKMEQMQAEMAKVTAEADAGAGAVRVTVNGKMRVVRVQLDKPMIAALAGEGADADQEMIEELIVSATNAAFEKVQDKVRDQMMQLTGGMDLPGLT